MKIQKLVMVVGVLLCTSNLFAQSLTKAQINEVIPGSSEKFHKLRYMRTVLDRVLYRGGGPGGKVQLSDNNLKALCEDNFSGAVYLYSDGFKGPQTITCADKTKSVHYVVSGFRGTEGEKTLRAIYNVIKSQSTANPLGPIFVHCWNGWHASGEISAYALRQFCDMSGDEAAAYWGKNIGDQGNLPKYGSIQNRIRAFQKIPGLEITAEEKSRICPR